MDEGSKRPVGDFLVQSVVQVSFRTLTLSIDHFGDRKGIYNTKMPLVPQNIFVFQIK